METLSWQQLFKDVLNFELEPQTSRQELQGLINKEGLHSSEADTWVDLFHRLVIERIEPVIFSKNAPVFVTKFPLL